LGKKARRKKKTKKETELRGISGAGEEKIHAEVLSFRGKNES